MDRLFRYRVFSRRNFQRVRAAGEVQVIGFYAARRGIVRRVGVNGDEQISLLFIGDGGARLQRNESVIVARIDDFSAELIFQQLAQLQRNVQHQVFFFQPVRADR